MRMDEEPYNASTWIQNPPPVDMPTVPKQPTLPKVPETDANELLRLILAELRYIRPYLVPQTAPYTRPYYPTPIVWSSDGRPYAASVPPERQDWAPPPWSA